MLKKGFNPQRRHNVFKSILCVSEALDWKITFDFHNNFTIAVESNVDTLCRPDTVIFSLSKKVIIWFELTVPLERNIFEASKRKRKRYSKLKADLEVNGWRVHDFTI